MKKAGLILLLVLLAAGIVWLLTRPCCMSPAQPSKRLTPQAAVAPPQPSPPPPEGQAPPARVEGPVTTSEVTQATQGTEGTAPEATPPALTPDKALDSLHVTFKNYSQRFKGNPVGNNAEITAALNGKNPGEVRFLGESPKLNEKGELLDGWGTPYFFHQLGGYDMEIHSAGPDRKMFTADDLVTH